MTGTRYIAAPPRATVRIPTASGEEIEAWVYRPGDDGPHPAVVMAHGLAAVKAGGAVTMAPLRHALHPEVEFPRRHSHTLVR